MFKMRPLSFEADSQAALNICKEISAHLQGDVLDVSLNGYFEVNKSYWSGFKHTILKESQKEKAQRV